MKLKNQITQEQFEHEFLKGEFYKPEYDQIRSQVEQIVTHPDFQNPKHNRVINHLLWTIRKPILEKLPTDIKWWEADFGSDDFENTLIIREIGWEKTFGTKKKMKDVGQAIIDGLPDNGIDIPEIREIQKSIGTHPFSERLILIAENTTAPATVIEGNHRAVAFELEKLEKGQDKHFPKQVIVGISPNVKGCVWWNWI